MEKTDHIKNITNSIFVDNHWCPGPGLLVDETIKTVNAYRNPFAECWRIMPKILIGIHDVRARVGTFTTPWNAPSNPLYRMPELKFINDSLSDLMDQRAVELYNEAKRSNKKIAVMWSGGIDSTGVLVSLLKNIPTHEHRMIEVVLTTLSIFENMEFWRKYISGKLKQTAYMTVQVTTDYLDNYILIHGDPADCLFGPSFPMYKNYFLEGKHLEPHTKHRIKVKYPPHLKIDFNEWYYKKVSQTIYDCNQQDYVSTVADFWWWTYFNFKWEVSCQRPLFYMRWTAGKDGVRVFKNPIPYSYQQEWAKNTFFNTDKFQQWSYSNLKTLIPKSDMSQHKILIKKYIHEYDHDDQYFYLKPKIGSKSPSQFIEGGTDPKIVGNPVYYDRDWVGYLCTEDNHYVAKSSRMLLDGYQG